MRGTGYFMSLELVKDRTTRETFSADECQVLLREFLSPQLQEAGVICRADDRGDPVIQLSPPLICTRRAHRRGRRRTRLRAAARPETHANRLSRRPLAFDLTAPGGYPSRFVTEVSVALLDPRLRRITTGVTGDALLLSLIALLPR